MALPCELIYDEILCCLPVKDLLRYRCVSKDWCSIIDSKKFVEKHLKKSMECNPNGVIISGGGHYYLTGLECLYGNEDVAVTEINDCDPLKNVLEGCYFVGAVNCLACFSKNERNEFIVLNPSTRKYKRTPSMLRKFARWFEMSEVFQCGFGYDEDNDDYKVVKIKEFSVGGMMVMIYSLKSNCWRQVVNVPLNVHLLTITGMFTIGALHWLAESVELKHKVIVGFDLGLEQFKEVPFPAVRRKYFVPSGGPLQVFDYVNSRIDVWMINKYGKENPWYKAFSVEESSVLGSFEFIIPVAFSKSGKDVLLDVDSTKLVWYDPKSKEVKNFRIHGIPTSFASYLYRESLLELTENEQLQKPLEDKTEKKRQQKRDDFLSKGFKLKL